MDEEGFDREEAKRELKGYLNERMRVRISDGRVVEGMFQCTDKHRNLVLANCEEYLTIEELEASKNDSTGEKWKKVPPRSLNLAIIPGEHICTIELAMDASEPPTRDNSPPPSIEDSHPSTPSHDTFKGDDSPVKTPTQDTPSTHCVPSNSPVSDSHQDSPLSS